MGNQLKSDEHTKKDDNFQNKIFSQINVITTILTICSIFIFIFLIDNTHLIQNFTGGIIVIFIPSLLIYLVKFITIIAFRTRIKNKVTYYNELRNFLLNLSFFIPTLIIELTGESYSILNYMIYFLVNTLIYSVYFIISYKILKKKNVIEYYLIFMISLLAVDSLITADFYQTISPQILITICVTLIILNAYVLLTTKHKSWSMIVVLNLLLNSLKLKEIITPNMLNWLILVTLLFIVLNILSLIFKNRNIKWPLYIHNLVFISLSFDYIRILSMVSESSNNNWQWSSSVLCIASFAMILIILQKSIDDNKNIL